MRKHFILIPVLLFTGTFTIAQTVSGKVTGSDGAPLPGVSLLVKGTTNGTITDIEGRYSVDTGGSNATLMFSYIGYISQEISVGNRSSIDVSLVEDIKHLSEVVVTALGIEKDTKSLAYSVTVVGGQNLQQAREVNVANSLVGRVAGVNVGNVSGGAGSSSNVVIRGVNSLSGAGPLYVINGVPIDNTQRGAPTLYGGADLGDGIANINPDDIEDITVLKGATAGALYGSRGTNGVILVTTKKGRGREGLGAELNSNYTIDRVMNLIDFQDMYGQGTNGLKPTNQAQAASTNGSWGALLDGSNVIQFDGVARPYVAQKHNYDNFYRTGSTSTNTLSVGNSFEKGSYRFSAAKMVNEAILPSSGLTRNSFNLNLNYKIVPKLIFDVASNYVIEEAKNRAAISDSPANANFGVTFLPTSYDVRTLAPGYDPITGAESSISTNIFYTNPWFAANRYTNNLDRNRLINIATLRYNPLTWLSIQGRVASDITFDKQKQLVPTGTAYRPLGNLNETVGKAYENNMDGLVTISRSLSKSISATASVGGNIRYNKAESTISRGISFSVPFLYNLNNTVSRNFQYNFGESLVRSIYYTAEVAYKDMLFLTTTGRQDWFSALDGRSILYPSIGLSFVFTEFVKSDFLTFGKIRSSWARSTGDPTSFRYKTNQYYNLSGSANGFPQGQITGTSIPNANLKPYSLTEIEVGLELKFFQGRVMLDAGYFERKTKDELLDITTSPASGYTAAALNVGSIQNKGFEGLLTITPVKTKNLSWAVSFNYTNIQNKVLALSDGIDRIAVATSRTMNGFIQHVLGEPASQIMAFDYKFDANGNIVYDANGYPIQGELKPWGSSYQPIFGGINNEFNYKHFNFSFLVDFKSGGKVFSATDFNAYLLGLHKATLVGRTDPLLVGKGVNEAGQPNTIGVTAQNYYSGGTGIANRISKLFVQDASFVKLRQIVIGYNIPINKQSISRIKGVSISVVARNIAILKKYTDNIDPEASLTGGPGAGLELAGVPPSTSYGANVTLKF